MDTREKLIATRLRMLALADELKNISRARWTDYCAQLTRLACASGRRALQSPAAHASDGNDSKNL
jgi:hypothetical protein